MNTHTSILSSLLPLLALNVAGCAIAPIDPEQEADPIAEAAEEINGLTVNATPGVVQITVTGESQVRTGILLGNDLVMTSARVINGSTEPARIQIRNGTGNAEMRTGMIIVANPYMPVVMIQTTQPFTTAHNVVFDPRSAQQMVTAGQGMTCMAYRSANEFQRAAQLAKRIDGPREYIVGPVQNSTQRLDDLDAGAPCFDLPSGNKKLLGFAHSSPGNNETRLFVASEIEFFARNMTHLAEVRRDSGNGSPFMVQTTAPNGSRMCLDIAWGWPYDQAGVRQFPCGGATNQRWFYDFRRPSGVALINAITGTCIDVPGGSTQPGTALQTFRCQGGPNQGWEVNTGHHLSPQSAPYGAAFPYRALCMSVRGGASASSQLVEQSTCVPGAAHQDWDFSYVP